MGKVSSGYGLGIQRPGRAQVLEPRSPVESTIDTAASAAGRVAKTAKAAKIRSVKIKVKAK